jgi:flagellar basal-body rod protein FlgB
VAASAQIANGTSLASASDQRTRLHEQKGSTAMMSSMFDASTLPLLEQVVNFTEARHGVLAGNIANLDTPGYRTRDLSSEKFQGRLEQAIEERTRPSSRAPYPGAPASPPSISTSSASSTSGHENQRNQIAAISDDFHGMLRHDDNNSSMEEQISEITKNQQVHNMALSLMTAQFRLLRAAITERA